MRSARRLDGLQPLEAADAVIDVHDEVAGCERRDLGEEILRALGLALGPHEAVAEDVLLAEHSQVAGLEAGLHSPDGDRHFAFRQRQRVREPVDRLRLRQSVIVQHVTQALARTLGPDTDEDALVPGLQRAHVLHGGVEDIGALLGALGDEVAAAPRFAVDDQARR